MKIAYALLAHQHPDLVCRLVKRLTQNGSLVCLHYDLSRSSAEFTRLKKILKPLGEKVIFAPRVKVGWGEWSIVEATINSLNEIALSGVTVDYVHLLSGSDYPIKPETQFKEFLSDNNGQEFIEAENILKKTWVNGGLSKDRYAYRHFFNWSSNKKLFDYSYKLQKKFSPKRQFPNGLTPHMGSQWWTLTWHTCEKILEYTKDNNLVRFFKTVWIPDEMFFQTLVAKIVGREKIYSKPLTYYQFDDNGVPLVFMNDHGDFLLAKKAFFFARKLSPYATKLRNILDSPPRALSTKPTIDYDTFYSQNANPFQKGRRIIGAAHNNWMGDLVWNKKPYFAIISEDIGKLNLVQEYLDTRHDITCHGRLFKEKSIEFFKKSNSYANFEKNQYLLRNHSEPEFLTKIINADATQTVFLLHLTDSNEALKRCFWDENCHLILIQTSPLYTNLFFDQFHNEKWKLQEKHLKKNPQLIELTIDNELWKKKILEYIYRENNSVKNIQSISNTNKNVL